MATKKKTTSTEKKPRVSIKKAITETKTEVTFPRVTIGSHLTVTEFANGTTFLAWNDDALLKEIRAATK
jgi:hypothetical protein